MIPYALRSTKDFVSRYVVVDKDGSTADVVRVCAEMWGLDVEIHVRPDLNLRDSRLFAMSRLDEPWILIQDGDEVYHVDGPQAVFNLRRFMNRPNTYLCAPIILLWGDLGHTDPHHTMMPAHPFMYQNNGTFRASGSWWSDQPDMKGLGIRLPWVYKFNCIVKPLRRLYYREFRGAWLQARQRFPSIEDYVRSVGLDLSDEDLSRWFRGRLREMVPYDESIGRYPRVLRDALRNGSFPSLRNSDLLSDFTTGA